eukprot:14583_4
MDALWSQLLTHSAQSSRRYWGKRGARWLEPSCERSMKQLTREGEEEKKESHRRRRDIAPQPRSPLHFFPLLLCALRANTIKKNQLS